MDTMLLQEYRAVCGLRRELLSDWLALRLEQAGWRTDGLRALLDSGKPGPCTTLCASLRTEGGAFGPEGVVSMLLHAALTAARESITAGTLSVLFFDTEAVCKEEAYAAEIRLLSGAALGEAVCTLPGSELSADVLTACRRVLDNITERSGSGIAVIGVGAGTGGLHPLALEHGADILRRLIALRHQF